MIVVTGAAGRLGSLVVRRLVDRGYQVRATDRVALDNSPTEFAQVDLRDSRLVGDLLKGADSVIHMGAVPGPSRGDPREIFENNVQSTFNIFMTAEELDVRQVVFSSSAFAMGWAHDPNAFVPLYLPLDEDHPMTPFEPYGLSKQVGESIGALVARRSSTSVASLRFTNVALPEIQAEFPWPAPTPDNPLTLVMWAYADAEDVADAHVLALEADIVGHEAFMIAQPKSRFKEDTIELVERNFGSKVAIHGDLIGNSSPINASKAQRMLGWQPRSDWTEH